MIGRTEDSWRALPEGERAERLQDARRKFLDAGAHYVIETLAELDQVISQIEVHLRAGERPQLFRSSDLLQTMMAKRNRLLPWGRGDREIGMVLTAIERAEQKNPRPNASWRMEHSSVMNQSLLDRAKKDGVILVFHSYMWEYGEILASYGRERLSMMHAYRNAVDMGIPVAGHSDSPISAAYPLPRIQDMVTRKDSSGIARGENQRISVDEAIKVWTLNGAYATFEENIKGSIVSGKLADFVILEKDPRKVPPDTIQDIVIEATYFGGQKCTRRRRKLPPQFRSLRSTMVIAITATEMKKKMQVYMFTELSRAFAQSLEIDSRRS